MLGYIVFPQWLTPNIAPGIPIRWYGIMYLLAFATTYVLFRREAARSELHATQESIDGFFFWSIIGVLVGGRLSYVLFFDTTTDYLSQPWLVISPVRDGQFTGIQGMNFHGGFVGAAIAVVLYTRAKKLNLLDWGDTLAVCVPLGYTFGRIGNFINEELQGRVTAVPWGVVFPRARYFPRSFAWVQSIEQQSRLDVDPMAQMVSLPRHASQLYEAFLEGIVLWLILWFVFRIERPFRGASIALYTVGYGCARFIAEFFKETSDASLLAAEGNAPDGLLVPTTPVIDSAQWLSLALVLIGLGLFIAFRVAHRAPATVETYTE